MGKLKQVFLKQNVLEATKERISRVFDDFENIIVSISGGKDSTVLAHLALVEANKRGRKIGLFFLDEEVVYESTINQIRYLMSLYPENTNKLWLQIDFNLTNCLSADQSQLKCWEVGKHKEWMRPKEKNSIQYAPWNRETETVANKTKGFGFYDVITNFENCYHNTAFLIGLRALESMHRWGAVTQNAGYSDVHYSTKRPNGNFSIYPIYDWNYPDIWKYIYDNKLKYSVIYDYQFRMGVPMTECRVSSLIHEKSFKAILDLQAQEPKTFNKLMKRVKGVHMASIYAKESKVLAVRTLPESYKTWQEYRDFLLETYPHSDHKAIFVKRFSRHLNNAYVARQQCRQLVLNDYENNLTIDNKPDPRDALIEKYRNLL